MKLPENIIRSAIGILLIEKLGMVKFRNLLVEFGSPDKVVTADRESLAQSFGEKMTEKILNCTDNPAIEKILEKLEKIGADMLVFGQPGYPERLTPIYAPPVVLFVLGELAIQDERAIAIVGTRRPSHNGIAVTEKISAGLARSGVTVISGLALGIDGMAHRTALKNSGRTIAVLGSALDVIYPRDHKKLAEQIIDNGAVISEFLPGTRPEPYNFPRRNRIISGISLGVVVVEAGKKSGALITANHAIEQGKEVFAVPGSAMSAVSEGTNKLLKDGARCVTSAEDILDTLKIPSITQSEMSQASKKVKELTGAVKIVFELLTHEPIHVDDISRKCKMNPAYTLSALLTLELQELVKQLPGKRFVKNI